MLFTSRLTDPLHKLSCEQSIPIFATFFGLGDVKVEAAKAIYPRLVDANAFPQVLCTVFKYEDERSQVKQVLGLS